VVSRYAHLIVSFSKLYYDNISNTLYYTEWEFGKPWESTDFIDKWSPDKHVNRWKTPTLVTHGGQDFRVVDSESICTFTALQRRGIPSRLIHFPNECHHINHPLNSLSWYVAVIDWLERWMK
jgi:dipeptidyl aminopeptidase/acylaminoacyl peptidase